MKRGSFLVACLLFGATCGQTAIADQWYVALDGTGQGTGGWANATNDLQGAIDACVKGDTVWVSNGVYQTGGRPAEGFLLTNRIVITKAITVRSLSSDPTQTVIQGKWDPEWEHDPKDGENGPASVRCVYMSFNEDPGASLIGFTLSNGATLTLNYPGAEQSDQKGGGIHVYDGAMSISNCIFTGNSSSRQGSGIYARGDSLAVYDCVIVGNTSGSKSTGSGAYGGVLYNCLITSNSVQNAVVNSTLYNCLVVNNTADYAVQTSISYNCTIAKNKIGVRGGTIANKTFNSIVAHNNKDWAAGKEDVWPRMHFCCTTPEVTGDGNITNAPSFVDLANNDYRLKRDSPCINAGTNGVWTTSGMDFSGNLRIDKVSGFVDMGCYEYDLPYPGTILRVQ